MSFLTSVTMNAEHNVMVNSEELVGTTECLTLYARFRMNRCRYNRVRLLFLTPLCTQKTHPHIVVRQEIETEIF